MSELEHVDTADLPVCDGLLVRLRRIAERDWDGKET